ncbi:MAG: trehalose-phosphatase [Thermomicrobiales bacterium]
MEVVISSVPEVLDQVLAVLKSAPAAVLTDFDGTLSPVAPVPDAAFLHPDVARVLPELKERLHLLAVITGRATADASAKVGIPDLLYVGNHGLEWSENGVYLAHPVGIEAERAVSETLAAIEDDLKSEEIELTGLLFENKRLSASIHYRLVTDPPAFEAHLIPIAERRAAEYGLRLSGGKMTLELRPTSSISKGTAVEQIVKDRGLNGAMFFGDDVTDVDAFRALKRLRADGLLKSALAIGVLSTDTHPSVIAESDLLLGGVDDVAALFVALAEHLATGDTESG